MASWRDSIGFIAADPARVAIIVTLAQTEEPLDEMVLTQLAGHLHQRFTGHPVETAVLLNHLSALAGESLVSRDDGDFRWSLTPLGELVSRQWAARSIEPEGEEPLNTEQMREWRDRLVALMEHDAELAAEAGVADEELLASLGIQLAELRVLNRVLGEDRIPAWLQAFAGIDMPATDQ